MLHPDLELVLASEPTPAVVAHVATCPRCRLDRRTLLGETEAPALPVRLAPGVERRYTLLRPLGRGGFGEVYRAKDHALDRDVALKLLRDDRRDHAPWLDAEARVAARLQHPFIPAVYEIGRLADDRPYYAMAEARGMPLRSALAGVDGRAFGLRRFVAVLASICDAVAHAHGLGIAHRDLKPENIRLDAADTPMLLDWGLASGVRPTSLAAGTPGYRAPEVDAGNDVGAPADVWALGTLLAELLHRAPPPVDRAWDEPFPPGSPEALTWLCRSARSTPPSERPAASALGRDLRAWLDGEARTDLALELVARANDARSRRDDLRRQAALTLAEAYADLDALPTWSDVASKRTAWATEDRARALDDEAQQADLDAVDLLGRALELSPGLPSAADALARHRRETLVAAERSGHRRELARAVRDLEALGPPWSGWLDEPGLITLRTEPPTTVVAERMNMIERRSQVVERLDPGPTPLVDAPLPSGRWRLRLGEVGALVVEIGRGERWSWAHPDGSTVLHLPEPVAGACWVPPGWFTAGGDPEATDPLPTARVWVDGFHLQTHPVTVGEFVAFLNDVSEDEAMANQPRITAGGQDRRLSRDGSRWLPIWEGETNASANLPITCIPSGAARAYARWWSARTGSTWSLPHELEWEKAARPDGRAFPWGAAWDPAFACGAHSHPGVPGPVDVQEFPFDQSPFGVRGLAGNVRDMCANAYSRRGDHADGARFTPSEAPVDAPWIVVRGGNWASVPSWCRAASRFACHPEQSAVATGFRLVRRSGSGETSSSS